MIKLQHVALVFTLLIIGGMEAVFISAQKLAQWLMAHNLSHSHSFIMNSTSDKVMLIRPWRHWARTDSFQ